MTIEQGAVEADVRIRASGRPLSGFWMTFGGFQLGVAASYLQRGDFSEAKSQMAVGGGLVVVGLASWLVRHLLGVDLTREFAVIRGLRRRTAVPWWNVQAVVRREGKHGQWAVNFLLENGESVKLPYPRVLWRKGHAQYELDFQLIDQWWVAHRGELWRLILPEALRTTQVEVSVPSGSISKNSGAFLMISNAVTVWVNWVLRRTF